MSLFAKRILVVEDEIAIAMDIEMRLQRLGFVVTGTALDARETMQHIIESPPDLVLLDVRLGEENDGIHVSKWLKEKGFPVVFLTAFTDRSTFTEALATEPLGYVTKPFRDDDLQRTIMIALQRHEQERRHVDTFSTAAPGTFFVREKGQLFPLSCDDLLWLEALDNYTKLYTSEKTYTIKAFLKDIERKLPPQQFLRVHRSFIIPVARISRIEENTLYIGRQAIPIGRQYREALMLRVRVL